MRTAVHIYTVSILGRRIAETLALLASGEHHGGRTEGEYIARLIVQGAILEHISSNLGCQSGVITTKIC